MSFVDENRGVCPGGKHNSSIKDIFALDQPTGRPSILRQTENLPSKTLPKGAKVAFQTPRRDPVTKRIVSPTKSIKMANVEECTKAMECLNMDKINILQKDATEQPDPKQGVSSYPDDDMPIQSRGGYQFDFDNLDSINPFLGSVKMVLSPERPAVENPPTESQHTQPQNILEEPTKIESALLDETLPFTPSVENSLVDISTDISSSDSSVVTVAKFSTVEEQDSCTATPDEKQPGRVSPNVDQDKMSDSFMKDAPLPAKGAYTLDFDNLDAVNPFQTGVSNIENSPVLVRKMPDISSSVEETKENKPTDVVKPEAAQGVLELVHVSTDDISGESSVVTEVTVPVKEVQDSCSATPDEEHPVKMSPTVNQDNMSASLVEDAPLPVKGAYTLDFDNLDAVNPFQTGVSNIQNSPVLGRKVPEVSPPVEETKESKPTDVVKPEATQGALELVDISINVISSESSMVKVPAEEVRDSCSASPVEKQPAKMSPTVDQNNMSDSFVEDAPLPVKGAYTLDFDNFDAVNPFQTGGSKIPNSPVLGRKVPDISPPVKETQEKENTPADVVNKPEVAQGALELGDFSIDVISGESSVVTAPADKERDSCSGTLDVKQPAKMSPTVSQDNMSGSYVEDAPLLARGAYTMDFDNFDAVNPFQTGGSKIPNSPVLARKVPDISPPVEETQEKENKPTCVVIPEMPVQPEKKPVAAVAPVAATTSPAESTTLPTNAPIKEEPIKMEFNFDDGNEVKRKPPPMKFGKRPAGVKPRVRKSTFDVKPTEETSVMPDSNDVADVPVSKGAYSFDFDKLDDPNCNPFGSTASVNNSPECSKESGPVLMETSIPEQVDKPVEKEAVSSVCAAENVPAAAQPNRGALREDADCKAALDQDEGFQLKAEQPVEGLSERSEFCQQSQLRQSQTNVSEFNEMFVPGTLFMSNDFDGQMDYLEQFGSSTFKESALRKQSLYLKFDPLLRESPKKSAGPVALTHAPRPAAFVSRLETPQMTEKTENEAQKDHFKLFDATAPQANAEDAIIEVLKYSQKDMDAAIARVQAEGKEKEEQWSAKYKNSLEDGQEMRKIIAEFELMIAKMTANQESERELAQTKLNEALLEKEQVSSDLNTMERSFSDLFKRLEKYKDVVAGYKKNEETLKACARDYLTRIKKEEQRYHTLKAHAEEKITFANQEIAEVRSKNKAESSALQAQLRREQLKVQSLEKSLDQKVKEAEELTKLCDELIAKVHKG
ncbi:transforming acidic coiled-coil-containing protein 3 isoform X2 [Clinocottus analis]|uniref:transforming acidic coiled-coil-containing protein 3 isoform X2 n=1 Tax=Clinocottus analis TaxID=304258 RepID=UPI0035C12A80